MGLVDFTNPEAWAWYASLVEKLLRTGVDTLKTDFGERIPHVDVVWHDGSDTRKMHK
jgi:alpha-D-xyloside xylohydrolase